MIYTGANTASKPDADRSVAQEARLARPPRKGSPARTSPPRCTSARRPSSGTSARSSPSIGSAPGGSCGGPAPSARRNSLPRRKQLLCRTAVGNRPGHHVPRMVTACPSALASPSFRPVAGRCKCRRSRRTVVIGVASSSRQTVPCAYLRGPRRRPGQMSDQEPEPVPVVCIVAIGVNVRYCRRQGKCTQITVATSVTPVT